MSATLAHEVGLARLDATAQAALVRAGEVEAVTLVELAIERIERANPTLGAVATPMYEDARRRVSEGLPDGPFTGVPILLKDFLGATGGDPYYAGMRGLRSRAWRASRTSHLAQRLRDAGFVVLGRTNTPELALMLTTEPLAFGPTRNPWKLTHSPGGSSGGAAAAVAAGLVPVAHGNDGAGSIRVPASACGLVGLKPSRGRISLGPEVGESLALLAVEGALTRSVRDTAAMLDVMAGPMPGDPCVAPPPSRPFAQAVETEPAALAIGLLTRAPGGVSVHPECRAAAEHAADWLAARGHRLEPVDATLLDIVAIEPALELRNCVNVAAALEVWGARTGAAFTAADVEPTTWELARRGRAYSAVELAGALAAIQAHGRRLSEALSGFDLLLSPTMTEPPPAIGEFRRHPDPLWPIDRGRAFTAFTLPFNVSGGPAISLPLHWSSDGLPIGVQLAAHYGREDLLLSVAFQLEADHPWAHHRPELPDDEGEHR